MMTAPKKVWQLLLKPNGYIVSEVEEDKVKEGHIVFKTHAEAMEAVAEHHYKITGETK